MMAFIRNQLTRYRAKRTLTRYQVFNDEDTDQMA
jgi:hypothetical protein